MTNLSEIPVPAPRDALPDLTFEGLHARLREAALRAGWSSLMPVQARAIPYLLARRDMMIQARTGSGKTGAFLLPMLERLDAKKDRCQALILVPTRELAQQVWQQAETICGGAGFRTAAVYGGVGYGPQVQALKAGAHIVVGTPGRALDRIARQYQIELEERILPNDEDVAKVVAERLTALLEARLRERDKLQAERSQRFESLARELAGQEDELPIITMLLDDYYQKMLHPVMEKPVSHAKSAPKSNFKKRSSNRRRGRRRR